MAFDRMIRNMNRVSETWKDDLSKTLVANEKAIIDLQRSRLSEQSQDVEGNLLPEFSETTKNLKKESSPSNSFPAINDQGLFTGNETGEMFASMELQTMEESFTVGPTNSGRVDEFKQSIDSANMAGRGKGAGPDKLFGLSEEGVKETRDIVLDDLRIRIIKTLCA